MNIANIIEGLQIAQKYLSKSDDYICADHDIIYILRAYDVNGRPVVTDVDAQRLRELGFIIEDDAWAAFV